MKTITILFSTIFFLSNVCRATVDTSIIKCFRQIIQLIESDNVKELAKLVDYPLRRDNPLPDIKNANEFISYYRILFDKSIKNLLKQYDDSIIFEHNGSYGLVGGGFHGEIWIDEDCKIVG